MDHDLALRILRHDAHLDRTDHFQSRLAEMPAVRQVDGSDGRGAGYRCVRLAGS